MSIFKYILGFALLALAGTVQSGPAYAQATRTWVSGVGDDVNPCSRTAPCKTFAGAISKTAAGGEINVLDAGGYGALTITKSITVNGYFNEAGVLAAATNGFTVNAAATDVVVLRGLDIQGVSSALNGIRFINGAALHVQDCLIRGFLGALPGGNGISFNPSGAAELFISDSKITNNGPAAGGAGVFISPTGSGSAKVVISNSLSENNNVGVRADTASTTGAVEVEISDSSLSGNTSSGVVGTQVSGPVTIMLNRNMIASNAAQGVRAVGATSVIRIGASVISGNATAITTGSGGQVQSYGNNQIDGNGAPGAAPTPVAPK